MPWLGLRTGRIYVAFSRAATCCFVPAIPMASCTLPQSSFFLLVTQRRPRSDIEGGIYPPSSTPSSSTYLLKWHSLPQKRRQQKDHFISFRKRKVVKAVAVSVAPTPADNAEHRQQLCQSYGFRQIGECLPDNVTLRDIIDTLPKKVFEIDDVKAWKSVLISVTSYALGIFMIAKAPWYLLPVAWAWTGTAITGFFVIGHDCAHKSFSRNKLVEDIVGTLAFLPLIYPYEPWRFKHDRHHAKTNMSVTSDHMLNTNNFVQDFMKSFGTQHRGNVYVDSALGSSKPMSWLAEDTAWHPVRRERFDSSPFFRKAIIYGYGPFRPLMSISHWLIWHFDLKKFRANEVNRVKISLACVFAFMAIGWPLMIYKTGITGWIKFWFMPWLGYHFWMSTFTMVHHTAPHIPFKSSDEWNSAKAQLNGTVHCNYPSWIEVLCHDINVHIPHHISPRIPSYNLRAAHQSLQQNWGKYMNEATWNWRLMKTILTVCHVYDKEQNYIGFDEIAPEDSQPITFLKRVMPNSA
ncbi:hypothetical protein BUALT_Bualt12G0080800 [Buddleja alternifolia]|uniref:Fatty acid desaturase domain-containing protein n=1 Tax=Buddleja alternifolia TaxID=168488 RepID=A0AAV6X000_9LAMI|nr:hypothetical protein BUALT_Bualt12G0080800 [Buddleja alternifolia]